MFDEEATVFNVAIQLVRVHVTAPGLITVFTAPACERANARFANVVGDVVAVVSVFLAAVFINETGQVQHRAQLA